MRLILILTAISSVFYASFSVANDWDDKTAYQLAIASYCAYGVSEDDPESNKSAVKKCLQDAVKKAKDKGSNVLDVFNQLPDDAVEIFKTSGEVTHKSINAAILVKINGGAIVAFRGTTESPWDWLHNIFLTSIDNYQKNNYMQVAGTMALINPWIP